MITILDEFCPAELLHYQNFSDECWTLYLKNAQLCLPKVELCYTPEVEEILLPYKIVLLHQKFTCSEILDNARVLPM